MGEIKEEEMRLSENIRHFRKLRNLSQDEIAKKLGYKSFTTIQKWETGASEPPVGKLYELAGILQVNIMDLLSDETDVINAFNAQKAKIATDALVQIATSHEAMGGINLHTKKSAAKILSKTLISWLKSDDKEDLIKMAAILEFTSESKLINLKDFIINQYYDADIDLQFKEYVEKEMKS